jgi:predicted NAD/FAD-dependent oxidoreductase
VYRWLRDGLVFRWSTGWSNGSLDTEGKPDGYPRFAVTGGMNALTKHLARGFDIELNVQLVSVTQKENSWLAIDETGNQYTSRAVIMTPPVPQGLALLKTGQTVISQEDDEALVRIEYAPCVAGLFWVDGPVNLPNPGAVQRPNNPISWIADNQRKGISPEATLITVHAGQEYSRFLWNQPADEAIQALVAGLSPFLEDHTKIIESQLKRWRYSLPVSLHPERCLTVNQSPPLTFAGDAFGEPRVEGAALSGMSAANKLLSILDHHSVYNGAK